MNPESRRPATRAYEKYRPFAPVALPDRRWPERVIRRAPAWCSVDLRDGNQALVRPMDVERKQRLFRALVEIGFREIEVGFPSAAQPEWEFTRGLIEDAQIPEDLWIQVLTQSRPDLIERTLRSIEGAPRAIVHLYNSTSTVQRRVVFGMDRAEIVEIAVRGAEQIRAGALGLRDTEVVLEYSPESFSQTELDFSVEICEAVMAVWEPTPERKMILNLPGTVEASMPNVYADQIEWFARNLRDRESVILSVHPHNDRGTAVAAAELAMLAGADRVEGTLFGNGERTGNVDVVTLALNLLSQGVDPGLDFSDIDTVKELAVHCTRMEVPPRHPYAGELVYTAFSGSHQDAIRKGVAALRRSVNEPDEVWEVPYLPIDPADVGRSYEAVVRINSQSGKGGVAYVLEEDHGFVLPRGLQIEFSRLVQRKAEEAGDEVSSAAVAAFFAAEYEKVEGHYDLVEYATRVGADETCEVVATIRDHGERREIRGSGKGPVDAFVDALQRDSGVAVEITDFAEHALGEGADAEAVAYVRARTVGTGDDGHWGVGRAASIVVASFRAVLSALNRARATGRRAP